MVVSLIALNWKYDHEKKNSIWTVENLQNEI